MPSKYLSKLQEKLVVLVGGTAGIGYGIAEGVLEFGGSVVVASRSSAKVTCAVERLKSSYPDIDVGKIRGQTVDLDSSSTDTEAQLIKLFDFATDNGARKVDHVVDTAGDLSLMGKLTLDTITPQGMVQATSVRLVGVMLLAKIATRYLKKEYTSSFTLTTGAMMYRPRAGLSVFVGAAGGKEPLTRALALDLAPVRVNLVSPGAVDTDLLWSTVPPGGSKEAVAERYRKSSILGRIGDVEDLVEAYLALMKSGYQTGTTIHVEGGYLLS